MNDNKIVSIERIDGEFHHINVNHQIKSVTGFSLRELHSFQRVSDKEMLDMKPVEGKIVFNKDTESLYCYTGQGPYFGWKCIFEESVYEFIVHSDEHPEVFIFRVNNQDAQEVLAYLTKMFFKKKEINEL
jgi:hypothetical protein